MDEKGKNAQKIKDLTKKEEEEVVKTVNKMSSTFDFIQKNMHNTQWMDTRSGKYEGLAGGLTLIHTLSLINLTRWLKRLTVTLIVLSAIHIFLILNTIYHWL